MTPAEQEAVTRIARDLYHAMPDAQGVPHDGTKYLWGEVDCTAHYKFCEAIAKNIVKNSAVTFVELD